MTAPLPPFAGIATFLRSPHVPRPEAADVAILGVPFDASVSYRSGSRFGPRAIREQSLLLWGYNNALKVAPADHLKIVDAGDVDVVPVDIVETHRRVAAEVAGWVGAGAAVVGLGGEHSISLPLLRACVGKHGPIAVVHFDAHPDTWDYEYPGYPYSHGTPFIRAIEEKLIDTAAYVQIGIRGPTYGPGDYADALKLGCRMMTRDEVAERGISATIAETRQLVGDRPVYITFDIDAVDPAFAPGTGTPEVGGFTSHEALQLLRGLAGLNIVGADVVEVAPAYDHAQITSILAANLVFEMLSLMAVR